MHYLQKRKSEHRSAVDEKEQAKKEKAELAKEVGELKKKLADVEKERKDEVKKINKEWEVKLSDSHQEHNEAIESLKRNMTEQINLARGARQDEISELSSEKEELEENNKELRVLVRNVVKLEQEIKDQKVSLFTVSFMPNAH